MSPTASAPVPLSTALTRPSAMLLRYRLDSGQETELSAESFLASGQRTLFYSPSRSGAPGDSLPLLGQLGLWSNTARLRGLDERGDFPNTGDAVDENGLLILPQRPLLLRVSDEDGAVIASFPVPESGLRCCPGERIPTGRGGHYNQLLLTTLSGEPVAVCSHDGWSDGRRQPWSSGRGFCLRVADAGWFGISEGDFRLEQTGPRRRPSPLA